MACPDGMPQMGRRGQQFTTGLSWTSGVNVAKGHVRVALPGYDFRLAPMVTICLSATAWQQWIMDSDDLGYLV